MIFAPLIGHAALDPQIELIHDFCVTKWKSDIRLQMRCSEKQAKIYHTVQIMLERYPRRSKQRKFIQQCALKWKTSAGGYDWSKVFDCADEKLRVNP